MGSLILCSLPSSTKFKMASQSLNGKVAVVTGSTQGLGLSIAKLFAEEQAAGLVICGRNNQNGDKAAASLTEKGVPTHYVQADLTRVEDCRKVVRKADEAFGRVDVLVNSAAITDRGSMLNTSEDLFDRMFAINTRAPFFLIQEAANIMIREKTERRNCQHPKYVCTRRPTIHCSISMRFEKVPCQLSQKNSAFSLMRK